MLMNELQNRARLRCARASADGLPLRLGGVLIEHAARLRRAFRRRRADPRAVRRAARSGGHGRHRACIFRTLPKRFKRYRQPDPAAAYRRNCSDGKGYRNRATSIARSACNVPKIKAAHCQPCAKRWPPTMGIAPEARFGQGDDDRTARFRRPGRGESRLTRSR